MVVSATPGEALEREWREHHLAGLVALIAGQEMGGKAGNTSPSPPRAATSRAGC